MPDPTRLFIEGTYLLEDTGRHDCAGGTPESGGAHERYCGVAPVMTVEQLDRLITRPPGSPRPVILESPYAGDVDANVSYARIALADSLRRGEAPFASHLLYTQPEVLDDAVPADRALGIEAGLAWGRFAEATVVYADLGITPGMKLGIERAEREGRPVEYRTLDAHPAQLAPATTDGMGF